MTNWTPERIARVLALIDGAADMRVQMSSGPEHLDRNALARIGLSVVAPTDADVERVARAIQRAAEQNGAAPWDALPMISKQAQEDRREEARAAIAAMGGGE